MSSRKQSSQTHEQQSVGEDNFKSNMQRSKMRGTSSGKKTAGPQPKNLEPNPPSESVRKTKKNKQKTPGNRDDHSTSEAPQPPPMKNRIEVKVKIPEELKPWLLFQLPAKKKKKMYAILEEHANCKKLQGNVDNKRYAVNEVVAAIKKYFNMMLGTQLLYKFERPQYAEILLAYPNTPMSQVYGAPHLLRLFVRIRKTLALLLGYLHNVLKYLAKNSASLYSGLMFQFVFCSALNRKQKEYKLLSSFQNCYQYSSN
uniref:Mortality factor 4-like protein 2 n=1 Tax=Chinchilla lanigera TaxID=34839 RepID=A0A8C2VSC1_CHILA